MKCNKLVSPEAPLAVFTCDNGVSEKCGKLNVAVDIDSFLDITSYAHRLLGGAGACNLSNHATLNHIIYHQSVGPEVSLQLGAAPNDQLYVNA